jgi:hypothetical protein
VLPPLLVYTSTLIGMMIVASAGLSFLGLGVQPPTPDWGVMVGNGRLVLYRAAHVATIPGIVIVVAALAFNFVGDGSSGAQPSPVNGHDKEGTMDADKINRVMRCEARREPPGFMLTTADRRPGRPAGPAPSHAEEGRHLVYGMRPSTYSIRRPPAAGSPTG